MSYPGTPSLSQETKDRITTTFHQTLDLAKDGRRREAVLGCDFILKMDPLYHPARTLQERLQGSDGPVETDDLDTRPASPPPSPPPPAKEPADPANFETMHLDASQVSQLTGQASAPSAPQASQPPGESAPPQVPPAAPGGDEALPSLDDDVTNLLTLDPETPPAPPSLGPSAPAAPPPPSRPSGTARIDELLDEGQVAFDAGAYQKAIDAWSRIFLIDIDHQEAAQRIEQARQFKAERERQVDEAMHEAMSHREAGRLEEARRGFERILKLQPNHITAREQLAEMESGGGAHSLPPLESPAAVAPPPGPQQTVPSPPPTPSPPAPAASEPAAAGSPAPSAAPAAFPPPASAPAPAAGGFEDLDDDFEGAAFSEVYDGDLDSFAEAGPTPGAPPPSAELGKGGAAKPQRSGLMLGLLVLIVVAGAGWFLYDRWGSIFPNAEEVPPPSAPTVDVVQRATRIRLAGNTAEALEQLRQLTPDDPAYARAQVLIEQWSADVETAAPEVTDVDREELERRTRRDVLLQRARQAYAAREYLPAAKAFKAADDLEPLEGAAADLYEDTKRQLRPIATQIDLYQQREWEMVVPMLWRKLEDNPDNRDLSRMLADSYFNLGVRDLQRGVPRQAQARFKEVVALRPDDQMAERLMRFSQAYSQSSRDVLYDIYVKQLRFRR